MQRINSHPLCEQKLLFADVWLTDRQTVKAGGAEVLGVKLPAAVNIVPLLKMVLMRVASQLVER